MSIHRHTTKTTKKDEKIGYQRIKFVSETFQRQHREFVFTVSIGREHARLIRWDRVGAVLSEPFAYKEDPGPLADFLLRVARAPPALQGFDTSVKLATEKQIKEVNEFVRTADLNAHEKSCVNLLLRGSPWPLCQVGFQKHACVLHTLT